MVRRGVLLAIAAFGAAGAFVLPAPAGAQEIPYPHGDILILREVRRNAIIPGGGQPLSVRPAPRQEIFDSLTHELKTITDFDAAGISPGQPGGMPMSSIIAMGLGPDAVGAGGQALSAGRAEASGVGGVISGAIGTAMNGLQSALSSLRGGGGGQ